MWRPGLTPQGFQCLLPAFCLKLTWRDDWELLLLLDCHIHVCTSTWRPLIIIVLVGKSVLFMLVSKGRRGVIWADQFPLLSHFLKVNSVQTIKTLGQHYSCIYPLASIYLWRESLQQHLPTRVKLCWGWNWVFFKDLVKLSAVQNTRTDGSNVGYVYVVWMSGSEQVAVNSPFSCSIKKLNIRLLFNVLLPRLWYSRGREFGLSLCCQQKDKSSSCIILAIKQYSRRQTADIELYCSAEGAAKQIVFELQMQVKSKQKYMNQQIWANPLFPHFTTVVKYILLWCEEQYLCVVKSSQ